MKTVAIESPYRGRDEWETQRNVAYGRACLADCLRRGESPYASHLLLTHPGVLRDEVPAEREQGIEAGLYMALRCDLRVVYTDLGLSPGMKKGEIHARMNGQGVEYRSLPAWTGSRDEDPTWPQTRPELPTMREPERWALLHKDLPCAVRSVWSEIPGTVDGRRGPDCFGG